jgi:hypothetical protein
MFCPLEVLYKLGESNLKVDLILKSSFLVVARMNKESL